MDFSLHVYGYKIVKWNYSEIIFQSVKDKNMKPIE